MKTRQFVEALGRSRAGVVEERDDWLMVTALGLTRMYVHKEDESVTPCLKNDGFWESWITTWFLNELTEDTWFLDIGANTGYYSMLARNKVEHVMAFEPNPVYTKMLRASINIGWEQSRGDWLIDNHFNVYEWAISDESGRATLNIPRTLHGSASLSHIDERWETSPLEVLTTTLDKATAGLSPVKMLIKIDAEGAEEKIWNGMQNTLVRHKPVLMMEYTPGAYSQDFPYRLAKYGDLYWINFDGKEEAISAEAIEASNDWLMLAIRPRENHAKVQN